MRWKERRQSTNVEDRRGARAPRMALGGGIGTVIVVVLYLVLGGDPQTLIEMAENLPAGMESPAGGAPTAAEEEMARFVSVVLADTEDVWSGLFSELGKRYEEPVLVLFADRVQSACGTQSAAVGPFYCPGDHKIYIDLSFYQELRDRLGAPGDFAQAYVIAHEVGHHVQNLLGISGKAHEMRLRMSEEEYNRVSVRLELQADFFAGVWAHHAQRTKQILEAGDIEEAMSAAEAIGDDRLQKQSRGYVVPDSFTHGTSAQRMRWFMKGFETGDMEAGDTFQASDREL